MKQDDAKGLIWSHVRGRWLVETPEETIRQTYLPILVNQYGFKIEQIAEEESVVGRGSAGARADFLIWRTIQDRTDDKPAFIVIECKSDIRLRAEGDRADPAFLAYVINGSIGRGQIDQVSRQIGGQANINTEEIRALRIPCPDPDVQRSLMKPVLAARKRIAALREQAAQAERAAFDHAEMLILGDKPEVVDDSGAGKGDLS